MGSRGRFPSRVTRSDLCFRRKALAVVWEVDQERGKTGGGRHPNDCKYRLSIEHRLYARHCPMAVIKPDKESPGA